MTTTSSTPTITDLGQLASSEWRGGISVAKMVADGFAQASTIAQAITRLNDYFVAENATDEQRCIDGRSPAEPFRGQNGAQIPGGTPGAALAYRLSLPTSDLSTAVFNDDARYLLERSLALGFVPGDHRDAHGHGIGCGAIDKMDVAVTAMLDPSLAADHKKLVSTLLGDQFSENLYTEIIDAAKTLQPRLSEYMDDREKSIRDLEDVNGHAVPTLEGDHHECLVIINTVPNTTFATKQFSDDFDGMQAFNYDVWRTFDFAEKLFANGELSGSKERLVTARVMTAVATLMVLTDGSQHALVRSK